MQAEGDEGEVKGEVGRLRSVAFTPRIGIADEDAESSHAVAVVNGVERRCPDRKPCCRLVNRKANLVGGIAPRVRSAPKSLIQR